MNEKLPPVATVKVIKIIVWSEIANKIQAETMSKNFTFII
jgi:hypothetical protein